VHGPAGRGGAGGAIQAVQLSALLRVVKSHHHSPVRRPGASEAQLAETEAVLRHAAAANVSQHMAGDLMII